MNITVVTIPHAAQRYDTAGDWQFDAAGNLTVSVSALGDWRYEFLVGLHELVETALCKQAGITQQQVDAFDMPWTPHDGLLEPGEDPEAPYHDQHMAAMGVETTVMTALGVDDTAYEKALDTLG